MQQFFIRRLFQSVPILIGISILLFIIVHASPGSPTTNLMDPQMTADERIRLESKLGLDKPIPVQYLGWLSETLHGNLGYSNRFGQPVKEVIKSHMWNTFYLSITALIISLLVGIPIGIISATKQYSKLDYGFTIFALFGLSIPAFFFALMLIMLFSIRLQIFPISGMVTPGKLIAFSNFKDIAWHTVLPAIVLGLASAATFMRYTRSSMLEVIRQDYIRTARSKGLREKVVIYKHALRNALIPIITLLGFQVRYLFSGALLTETVFGWPGMGKVGYMAVMDRDYPLILGVNLFLAILTLVGNLTADILYGIADPRIRYD